MTWSREMLLTQIDATPKLLDAPVLRNPNATVLEQLAGWEKCMVEHRKPATPAEFLEHRQLRTGEFWRAIPAYKDVATETFLDHSWQARNSATNPSRLFAAVGELVTPEFRKDVELAYRVAPMAMRLSPYLLAIMNWQDPYACPL